MCICLPPLHYIQQPKKPMHHWHTSAIWRAGAAGVCRRLGSKVAPGETTALVGNGRAASDRCNIPELNCKHEPQVHKKGEDTGVLRPSCSPCCSATRTCLRSMPGWSQETGMQWVKGTFHVCLFFQLSALANLIQKRICISAATAEAVAKFSGMLQPLRSKLRCSLECVQKNNERFWVSLVSEWDGLTPSWLGLWEMNFTSRIWCSRLASARAVKVHPQGTRIPGKRKLTTIPNIYTPPWSNTRQEQPNALTFLLPAIRLVQKELRLFVVFKFAIW